MATLYKADGTCVDVSPKNGTDFSLEELQSFVGGFIEIYNVGSGLLVCNENGKLIDLTYNEAATKLFREEYDTNDYIVGDVLVCDNEMVK